MSDVAAVDPEEAFVVALSSCHMLWFPAIAAAKEYLVNSYHDEPIGVMDAVEGDKRAITQVTLRPKVIFGAGKQPTDEEVGSMHQKAHENCFIANSSRRFIKA